LFALNLCVGFGHVIRANVSTVSVWLFLLHYCFIRACFGELVQFRSVQFSSVYWFHAAVTSWHNDSTNTNMMEKD